MLSWALAVAPVVLLLVLVLRSRLGTGPTALVTLGTAAVIGVLGFGAGPQVLAVAVGKGVWTGVWILYVVWTALLLYLVAARAGLDKMGDVLASVLPTEVENVLLLAWVFPAFVQGVAGFGTPIAVAAPLLVSLGLSPVRAVVLPLVGYHWSVTFGSMGSSFYMGALTAGLSESATGAYAREAALLLGVSMLLAGLIVTVMHAGWRGVRDAWPTLVLVGSVMFVTLTVAARIEPSITSLAAGTAGLAAVGLRRLLAGRRAGRGADRGTGGADRRRATQDAGQPVGQDAATPARQPSTAARVGPRPVLVALPYLLLLVGVLAVFLPEASRRFADTRLQIGPAFPATETSQGIVNPATELYTPIGLLEHPGSFILAACVLGLLAYRLLGMWPQGALRPTLRTWAGKIRQSSISILALATLATVMVDTGMVRTIALGAADATGALFPLLSPSIGALGSFTTGSSTTSNALFSALQASVADFIGVAPSHLVAAQTAGSNIGNSVAPVIVLLGSTAVGAKDQEADIIRQVAVPVLILLAVMTALVAGLSRLG